MMAHNSLLFSCLLLLICFSCISAERPKSIKLNHNRMLGGYYTQPGTFPLVQAQASIVQQQPGVYINVYFDKMTDGGSGSLDFNVKGGTMMLALYSSKTLLALDCQGFNKYNCSNFGCTELLEETDSVTMADFKGTGHYATANVFIDPNYWVLKTKPLLLTDCSSFKNDNFGNGTTGMLGLGVSDDALGNFITNQTFDSIMGGSENVNRLTPPIFSLFLTADGKSGELIFDEDHARALAGHPVINLSADDNWRVKDVKVIEMGNDMNISIPVDEEIDLMFDINADAIGFPMDLYTQVLSALNGSAPGLVCPGNVTYKPVCSYSESLDLLPHIRLLVEEHILFFLPSVYAEPIKKLDEKYDSITLNIRGLSPGAKDRSYVTPDFSNYIILDQHVLGYYYTVFDTTKQGDSDDVHIRMYLANHGNSDKALVTIIICVVIGLIVGLSIYRYKKIKKARMAANPPLLQTRMGDQELRLLPGQGTR